MADYLAFSSIYAAVEGAVKKSASIRDYIKAVINMVYLSEVMDADDLYPLFWMRKMDDSLAAVAPMTITGISAADPGVITVSAVHGLSTSDVVSVYGITVGPTGLNNRTFKVNSVPATTTLSLIDLGGVDAIDTTLLTAWVSGGTIVHRGRLLNTSGIDVESVLQCAWHGYRPMTEITPEEAEEKSKYWDSQSSRPERYLHHKIYTAAGAESNYLLWYPGADAAYDLRYWALTRAARLSADGDVPLLPPKFHDILVSGAITRLIESNVQVENAVVWPQLYKMQLKNLVSYNRKYYTQHEFEQRKAPYLL